MAEFIESYTTEELTQVLNKQAEFKEKIPVGSVVWNGADREHFGTTQEGRYYEMPFDSYIAVDCVDGEEGCWGLWNRYGLILKDN